jgi:LPS sulfotransferase NodH
MIEMERSIWLFMSHRTGSNFVSSILYRNKLGRPQEYFNHKFTCPLWRANKLERRDAVVKVISEKSRDGIFSVKLPFDHFVAMAQFLNFDPFELSDHMPHFGDTDFIWIRRRDKFDQAVSYWKAQVTGQWVLREGHDRSDLCVEYDYEGINRCYVQICSQEFLWTELFSKTGIEVRELVYEDFVRNRRLIEEVVVDLKGGEGGFVDAVNLVSEHKKIGNQENELFRERFVSDCFRRNVQWSRIKAVSPHLPSR